TTAALPPAAKVWTTPPTPPAVEVWLDWPTEPDRKSAVVSVVTVPRIGEKVGAVHLGGANYRFDKVVDVRHYITKEKQETHILLEPVIFSEEHIKLIVAGEKTQTRRRCTGKPAAYRVGADYAIQRKRGGEGIGPRLRIISCRLQMLASTGPSEARAEGYSDRARFFGAFAKLNNCTIREAEKMMVYAYDFRLLEE
ncbi:MAG TPA: hypothetical protein VGV69_01160, partial [Solirubrobacterales bacterium]|nr:hypothetical protein [Solirubrobacterales bacterium]